MYKRYITIILCSLFNRVYTNELVANELVANDHFSIKKSEFNIDFSNILKYANELYANAHWYADVILYKKETAKTCFQKSEKHELVCFNNKDNLLEYIEKIDSIDKINEEIDTLKNNDISDYEIVMNKLKYFQNILSEYIIPVISIIGVIFVIVLSIVISNVEVGGG